MGRYWKDSETEAVSTDRTELDRALGDSIKKAIDEDGERPEMWEEEDFCRQFRTEEIMYIAEKRKAKSRTRLLRVAAVFVCGYIAVSGAGLIFAPEPDADPTDVVDSLNGEVRESGIDGATKQGSVEAEECFAWSIEDEMHIAKCKAENPQLYVPGYVPEGYVFSKLETGSWEDGKFQAYYTYENKDKEKLHLMQQRNQKDSGWSSSYITVDTKKTKEGVLYYQEDTALGINNLYVVQHDDVVLQVSGILEWSELEKILNHFQK